MFNYRLTDRPSWDGAVTGIDSGWNGSEPNATVVSQRSIVALGISVRGSDAAQRLNFARLAQIPRCAKEACSG